MVLKRSLGRKETFPVFRVETCDSVCTGYEGGGKSNMVASSWRNQEGILPQKRKGIGLPYQHLQTFPWLVKGLQAIKVGVLVKDQLKSHVCADTGLTHLFSIGSFLILQLLYQTRELPPSFLT